MAAQELIQTPAIVADFKPKQDKSWKLVFETRELSGDEVKLLADNFQGEGFLVFKPNSDIEPSEIPEGQADAGMKTPSLRYRTKLFIYWKQRGGVKELGAFDNFYREHYAKLEEVLDAKLEPKED